MRMDKFPATRRMFITLLALLALLPASLVAEMLTHRVVSGDTLYNISKRYGVSIEDIKALNNLRDNTISLNQVLKIKEVDRYAAIVAQPEPQSGFAAGAKLEADANIPMFTASIDAEGNWLNIRRLPANALHAEDAAGNRYYAGVFSQKTEFGQITLQARTAPSGLTDTWLACQDSAGKWLWAKNLAFVKDEGEPQLALAVGSSGSVCVAGAFSGKTELNGQDYLASGGGDIWLAGFDKGGEPLWQTRASCSGTASRPALALGSNGLLCLAGDFSGSLTLGFLGIASGGETDIFAAGLDSAGNWLWAEKTNGAKSENLLKLGLAKDGALIIAGSSTGNLVLGGANIGSKPDGAGNVIFISRLSADGTWNWGSRLQQLSTDCFRKCFDTDAAGNTWFADNYYGNPIPNPIYDGALSVNSSLSLVDSQGRKLWTHSLEGTDVSIDWISSGRQKDLFMAGTFSGSLSLDSHKLSAGGHKAQFYARFDADGKCLWARKWLGTDLLFLDNDLAGNLYLVAKYRPYIDSGGEPFFLDRYEGKLFVARLDEAGNWCWAARTEASQPQHLIGADIDFKGNLRVTGSCPGEMSFCAQQP